MLKDRNIAVVNEHNLSRLASRRGSESFSACADNVLVNDYWDACCSASTAIYKDERQTGMLGMHDVSDVDLARYWSLLAMSCWA